MALLSYQTVCLILACISEVHTTIYIGVLLENASERDEELVYETQSYINTTKSTTSQSNFAVLLTKSSSNDSLSSVLQVCGLLEENISGLLSVCSCKTAYLLDSQMSISGTPHVTVTPPECTGSHNTIHMRPPISLMYNALLDIIKFEEWHRIAIFYDQNSSGVDIEQLIEQLTSRTVITAPFLVSLSMFDQPEDTLSHQLRYVKDNGISAFIIICDVIVSTNLLDKAIEHGLNDSSYFWLVANEKMTSSDLTGLDIEGWQDGNVVLIHIHFPDISAKSCSLHSVQLLARMPSNLTLAESYVVDGLLLMHQALMEASAGSNWTDPTATSCFNHTIAPWSQANTVRNALLSTSLEGVTNGFYFGDEGNNINVQFDICGIQLGVDPRARSSVMGTWTHSSGLNVKGKDIFPNVFSDFGGRTIIVTAREAHPFVIKDLEDDGTYSFTGYCFDILDELANRLNFKYVVQGPSDGEYGSELADGSWTGMIGMLRREEAAMLVGPLSVTVERENAIDFVTPFMEDGAGIIMRRPTGDANKIRRVFMPFSNVVWIVCVVSIIFIGVFLYGVNNITPFSGNKLEEEGALMGETWLSENVWTIFASYIEQGGEVYPRALSGRCLVGFWWLFTILISSTYTANLAAFLTVTITNTPINNLDQLAESNTISPLITRGTNLETLFKNAEPGTTYSKIWSKLETETLPVSKLTAYSEVETGNYAFMTDHSQLEYVVNKDCQTFILAAETFNTGGLAFAVPSGAPYQEEISYNILKMQEAGLMDRWKQKWWSTEGSCSGEGPTSSAQSLDLESLVGVFLVIVVAFLAAIIVFGVELIWHKLSHTAKTLKSNPMY